MLSCNGHIAQWLTLLALNFWAPSKLTSAFWNQFCRLKLGNHHKNYNEIQHSWQLLIRKGKRCIKCISRAMVQMCTVPPYYPLFSVHYYLIVSQQCQALHRKHIDRSWDSQCKRWTRQRSDEVLGRAVAKETWIHGWSFGAHICLDVFCLNDG